MLFRIIAPTGLGHLQRGHPDNCYKAAPAPKTLGTGNLLNHHCSTAFGTGYGTETRGHAAGGIHQSRAPLDNEELWQKQFDEVSATIRRTMLALLAYAFFAS